MVDPDCEARAILEAAGYCTDHAVPMRLVAEAHLGEGCVRIVRTPAVPAAVTMGERPRILLHPRVSPTFRRFVIAHEVAEFHLARIGYREEDVEQVADAVAAALVVPRGAFRRKHAQHGDDFSQLARAFVASQTCVALRLHEVTGRPVAILDRSGPRHVRDGEDGWQWPRGCDLQRTVDSLPPHIRRIVLTDSRKSRLALVG